MAHHDEALITFTPMDTSMERVFTLNPSRKSMEIGRASKTESKGLIARSDNTWFDSPVMSRTHAAIHISLTPEKNIFIKDLGSTHGTFICSYKLKVDENYPVMSGTIVSFGQRVTNGTATFHAKEFRITYKWLEWKPRGAHVNPERWNKMMRSERQSPYSDESESDNSSSREPSPERLTPKSLIDEAERPVPKKSNTGSTIAVSTADPLDAEVEYLASEEEEYEADPFEQELSDDGLSDDGLYDDGLSDGELSAYRVSNDVACKAESRDSDCVKDEVESDEASPPKIESEERSWHCDWNANGYSSTFTNKASGNQTPDEVRNKAARVHATPFVQKVLNAMRQSQSEIVSEPSTASADPNPSQSHYERPSSPSDAALFKATSNITTTKVDVPQVPLSYEDGVRSVVPEEDSAYSFFGARSQRRDSTPQPYSANISSAPEVLSMSQSYYHPTFQVPSYRDSVEPMSQKNEDASFASFGYGAYPSRPVAQMGYRLYPSNYAQDYAPNEAAVTTNGSSQPYWRNPYYSSASLSQTQVFPVQATSVEDPVSSHVRPYPKPTMLTISEIVSGGNSALPEEPSRGTKRKANEMMEDDVMKCQGTNSVASENAMASPDVVLPDAQPREDLVVADQQSPLLPVVVSDALQPDPLPVVSHDGPAKKKARTNTKASMLKTTRTFISGMLAGGLSVFGALLVYGATAPDSIQDRVRLEFS